MKTGNNPNVRKKEAESRNKAPSELTEQELEQVAGGMAEEDKMYFENAAKAATYIRWASADRHMTHLGFIWEILLPMAEMLRIGSRERNKDLIREYAPKTLDYINEKYRYFHSGRLIPQAVEYLNMLV